MQDLTPVGGLARRSYAPALGGPGRRAPSGGCRRRPSCTTCRAVLGAVVEGPAARLAATGLEPRPGALQHRCVHDAEEPRQRARNVSGCRPQLGAPATEKRSSSGAVAAVRFSPRRPPGRQARRCSRAGARGWPPAAHHPEPILFADLGAHLEQPALEQPVPQPPRACQLVVPGLDVQRVHELLHEPQPPGRLASSPLVTGIACAPVIYALSTCFTGDPTLV